MKKLLFIVSMLFVCLIVNVNAQKKKDKYYENNLSLSKYTLGDKVSFDLYGKNYEMEIEPVSDFVDNYGSYFQEAYGNSDVYISQDSLIMCIDMFVKKINKTGKCFFSMSMNAYICKKDSLYVLCDRKLLNQITNTYGYMCIVFDGTSKIFYLLEEDNILITPIYELEKR